MHRLALAALAALGFSLSPDPARAQQPIGLRVLVQPWTPATDDDTARIALDDQSLLSRSLSQGWNAARPEIEKQIVGFLGQGDLVADGFTFRDITLALPEPQVALQPISGGGSQPLMMRAQLAMSGVGIELTSTIPGPSPGSTDPRCSARADINLVFAITLGSDTNALLRAEPLPGPSPLAITNLELDSQGIVCDAIIAVVNVAGIDDVIRRELERAPAIRQAGVAAVGLLDGELRSLNAQLAAQVPPGLLRVNAWFNQLPNGQRLAIGFGVRPVADRGPPASITGTVRQVGATMAGGLALGLPFACEAMPVMVQRKTGPSPMINANGDVGPPPLERLPVSTRCEGAAPGTIGGAMVYRISGLSPLLPNIVTFTGMENRCVQGQSEAAGVVLAFSNWTGNRILSGDLARRFDMRARVMSAPCIVQFEGPQTFPAERPPVDERLVILQQTLNDMISNPGTPGAVSAGGLAQGALVQGGLVQGAARTRSAAGFETGATEPMRGALGGVAQPRGPDPGAEPAAAATGAAGRRQPGGPGLHAAGPEPATPAARAAGRQPGRPGVRAAGAEPPAPAARAADRGPAARAAPPARPGTGPAAAAADPHPVGAAAAALTLSARRPA
jgi:hypothetical protein